MDGLCTLIRYITPPRPVQATKQGSQELEQLLREEGKAGVERAVAEVREEEAARREAGLAKA